MEIAINQMLIIFEKCFKLNVTVKFLHFVLFFLSKWAYFVYLFFSAKAKEREKKTWTIIAMHNACSYSVFHIPYYILIKPQREKIVHRTVWNEPVKGVIVAVSICLLKWLAPFHHVKQTMNERQFACSLALLPSHCPWLETNSNSWHRSPYGVNAIFITTALLHLRDEKLRVFFFLFLFETFYEDRLECCCWWKFIFTSCLLESNVQMFVVHR